MCDEKNEDCRNNDIKELRNPSADTIPYIKHVVLVPLLLLVLQIYGEVFQLLLFLWAPDHGQKGP